MPTNNGNTPYFDVKSLAGQLYRPTRFEFYIPELPSLIHRSIGVTEFRKDFQFAVQDVFFPGRNLGSDTYKIAGPVDEIPYESVYSGDLDITARLSGDFKEKLIFESWQDVIINQRTQNLNYPDNYRCDAYIDALNYRDETVYQIKLTEVWPKTVGRVSVGQSNTDSVATMVIGLAFRRYFVTYADDIRNLGEPVSSNLNSKMFMDKIQQSRAEGAMEFPDPILVQEDFIKFNDPTSEYNAGSDGPPPGIEVES